MHLQDSAKFHNHGDFYLFVPKAVIEDGYNIPYIWILYNDKELGKRVEIIDAILIY